MCVIETVSRTMIRHSYDPLSVGTTSVTWGKRKKIILLNLKLFFKLIFIGHHEGGVGWAGKRISWVLIESNTSSEQHHIFLENYSDHILLIKNPDDMKSSPHQHPN